MFNDKEIKIVLSEDAKKVYEYLNKQAEHSKIERSILKAISEKAKLIKANPQYGDPISKKLIPKEYKKYEPTNLFRVELPNFWRMLYTLIEGQTKVEIVAFVLDITDHKDYNKKFGYK